jgi:hypothetical protein
MPHNVECVVYQSNYVSLLFYGGVIRFSTQIMIFGFVNLAIDGTSFGSWQGLSFSQSHAFRDMVGFLPHSGTIYDLFSLVADAPYDDTSTNVGGINDYTLMQSTGSDQQSAIKAYYYTQFYRYFETTSLGD